MRVVMIACVSLVACGSPEAQQSFERMELGEERALSIRVHVLGETTDTTVSYGCSADRLEVARDPGVEPERLTLHCPGPDDRSVTLSYERAAGQAWSEATPSLAIQPAEPDLTGAESWFELDLSAEDRATGGGWSTVESGYVVLRFEAQLQGQE